MLEKIMTRERAYARMVDGVYLPRTVLQSGLVVV